MKSALLHIFVFMISAIGFAESHDASALFGGSLDDTNFSNARAGATSPWGIPYSVRTGGGKGFECNGTLVGRKDFEKTCQLVFLTAGHCVNRQIESIVFESRFLEEQIPSSMFRVLLPSEFLKGASSEEGVKPDDGAFIVMTLSKRSRSCNFLTAEKIASLAPVPGGTTKGAQNEIGSALFLRTRDGRVTQGKLTKEFAGENEILAANQWAIRSTGQDLSEPGDSGGPVFDADGNLVAPHSAGFSLNAAFDPDISRLAQEALAKMDIPHVVGRQWKNLPGQATSTSVAAAAPSTNRPVAQPSALADTQPKSSATSDSGKKLFLVGKTLENGDKVLVLEDQDGEPREIRIDRGTGLLYWKKDGQLEVVPEPWQSKINQYYKHSDLSKLKKKKRELVESFLNPKTTSGSVATSPSQPSQSTQPSPAQPLPTQPASPQSFGSLFSGVMDARGNVTPFGSHGGGFNSPFQRRGGQVTGRGTPLFAGIGGGRFRRQPAVQNPGQITRDQGFSGGPVQPGSHIATPPPFKGSGSSRVSPNEWEHMRNQHNRMHSKPVNPPVLAAGTSQGEAPTANALSAIQKCMRCHTQGSDRHMQLAGDPASALFGLRDVLEQRNRGVSLFKIFEMMNSDKFGNLSADEKKGLIAFLTRQDESQGLEAIQAAAVQKYVGPPDTSLERFIPAQRENAYRNMLLSSARTDNPFLNAIFADPSTQYYDNGGMPKVYQDGGDNQVAGLHFEKSPILQSWDLPGGGKMFPNGSLRGPLGNGFGLPAGTQNFKFVWRPKVNGQTLPTKANALNYSIRPGQSTQGTLYDWEYPVGTIVGEVVVENGVAKDIRLREIGPNKTTMSTAYRPFPTADKMKERIQAIPNWQSNSELAGMVQHLDNKNRLVNGAPIKDDYYTRLVDIPGGFTDVLPSLSKGTAEQLIASSQYSSALHQEWDREGDKVAFMPTTRGSNITPAGMNAHNVRVDSKSCMQCHEHTMTNFAFLYPQAHNNSTGGNNPQDYGMTYGNSQNIFSLHPFQVSNQSFGSGGLFLGSFAVGGNVSDNRRNRDGSARFRSGQTIQGIPPGLAEFYSK